METIGQVYSELPCHGLRSCMLHAQRREQEGQKREKEPSSDVTIVRRRSLPEATRRGLQHELDANLQD